MKFFDDLGDRVEREWRDTNYHEASFPSIAVRALEEARPSEALDPWEVVRWLLSSPRIPQQFDPGATFGQPPATLYSGPRFHVDVYFWTDGTTTIHQHAFSGAFAVFMGSSIHSRYRFDHRQILSEGFQTGDVGLDEVELLTVGDVRAIPPGERFIHALFHLDRPSMTICVRSHQSLSALPQLTYLAPYLAVDSFNPPVETVRRVQLVEMLLSVDHVETDHLVTDLLSTADLQTSYAILSSAFHAIRADSQELAFLSKATGEDRFDNWYRVARRRHGELAERFLPVLEEGSRQNFIMRRRASVAESDHRYLLALLLNVRDRAGILELVRRRHPEEDPIDQIVKWFEELSNTRVVSSSEPNALGLPGVDDDYLFVLESLFRGHSREQMKAACAEVFSPAYAAAREQSLDRLYDSVRQSPLLRAAL